MDGLNNTSFQSVVILGLKTALLEAQDEINSIRKERDEFRKNVLKLIQANSKLEVKVINLNQLKTKFESRLIQSRKECKECKKELEDTKNHNVNLDFQVKELKSLLDIKTELLESLNIKGDKVNKDDRANYKTLMKHLRLVIENRPRYTAEQLLEDIQNVISRTEKGKPVNLSKYSVKKMKLDKEEINTCDDQDEKSAEIIQDFGVRISSSMSSSICFKNKNDNYAKEADSNAVPNDCSTKTEDACFLDDNVSSKTNLFAEKTNKIRDKPVINVDITDMPQLQSEEGISVISSSQKDEKDIGTISDSESDKTSGFCDMETEVESPPNIELSSHARSTPSPENHTLAMCMPDLLLSISPEKNTPEITRNLTKQVIERNTISKTALSSNSKIVKDDVKSPSPKKKNTDLRNDRQVQNILEEMKTMKNTMFSQVSSLEQFRDDASIESNSCFKRPMTLRSSHRESAVKNRNSTEDTANFVPKRSSQLVKRDPNSRSKIANHVSDELDKKLNPSIRERNDTKAESPTKSNLTRQVYNSSCDTSTTKNLKVGESFAIENSSSLRDVTSCFEKPIETTTLSLPQLPAETEIPNTIDAKDTSNELDFSRSDNKVAAVKIPSPEICPHLADDLNVSVEDELTNELENSQMKSLPCIEPIAEVSDTDIQIGTEEQQDDVATKENSSIPNERVLSEKNSSSVDEKPSLVLTKESNNAPEVCFDRLISRKASLDIDEKPCHVSIAENNDTSEQCLDIISSKTVSSDIDENPASQFTNSSTSDPKETVAILESSNESTVPENITTEEKISENSNESTVPENITTEEKMSENSNESTVPENITTEEKMSENSDESTVLENITTEEKISEQDVPKKRKCGRPRKALSVTKSEPRSTWSSATNPAEPSTNDPKTTRRTSTRSKTAAVANLHPSDTMNNGMERRKRKGKFNEILDSLKSKSKRRKSDYHPESPELVEEEKPLQRRRGRKRKTSLPVEKFESATQTNWSPRPRSESMVFQITEGISQIKEISAESEAVQSRQQIDDQTSSTTIKDSGYLSDEMSLAVRRVDSATQSEYHPSPCVLESCASVPISLLGKLIDMSKIIQEKASTIVESKLKIVVAAAKVETCPSLENKNISESPSLATNQLESFPISELEHKPDQVSSQVFEKCVESITESSMESSQTPTTPEAKLKQDRIPNSSDWSSESENDAESCETSTIPTSSEVESISVANLKQDQSLKSPNSSLEMEKCKESTATMDAKNIENRAAASFGTNLKQECVSSSSCESENVEQVTSSKMETEMIPSLDLERERLPDSSNSSFEEEITSSSPETTCKTVNPSADLKRECVRDSPNASSPSFESENDRPTVQSSISNANQSQVVPVEKLEQNVAVNSTSESRNVLEPMKRSIFDTEDEESPPIEISSKRISPVTRMLSSECEEIVQERCADASCDSDDEPPTQISFKKITAVEKSAHDSNYPSNPATMKEFKLESLLNESTNEAKPQATTRVPYEEEFSNSSGLSSQVSELDANMELISQFENVRTPPKVKDLFDSTDDENSNMDVFSILEEMKSASLCLSQRKRELVEFSRRLSPTLTLDTALAPPIIPSLAKYQMYSPPSRRRLADQSEIKDEDDSEDEMLVIAEDDQVNDNCAAGIEIDKFYCHDTNYSYALPAYTNSLTPSSIVNGRSSNATTNRNQTFTKQTHKVKIENENQATGSSNMIKFEFYKENARTEKDNGSVKVLSPFESIWENLKSLYVRNRVKDEEAILMPCCNSVPQLAFFYRIRETGDTKRPRGSVEENEVTRVENLIVTYLKNVRENEYVAVKDFKMSVNSHSAAIVEALTNRVLKIGNKDLKELKESNRVLKIANKDLKELKELLGYLANLCVDLETNHEDFITEMQSNLRDQIFVDDWSTSKYNGFGQVTCIISWSIMYTMLSQRSNNLKSVKDLLLEALCSFKYRAHPIAFGVLNAWSAVFNDASRNCLLTRIILFSLLNHSMNHNLQLYKVMEVREMITLHYRVKLGDKTAEDHVKESMLLFDDDTWVDAIVLLCKRKLFPWSYTNVVTKYLIQIVDRWKEHDFNEIILIKTVKALHKILLSCPMTAVQGSNKAKERSSAVPKKQLMYNLNPIFESLSNVLQCAKGSRALRETVAVAICGVSHLNFDLCSEILSKWDPPEGVISNKALEEMHLIMHRYRSNIQNWRRVILPKDERPKAVANRRNLAPRKHNGDFSKQHQYPVHRKNVTSTTAEPLSKKKKKKKKSKKNQRNPEQKKS